ncbi:hemocyanin G chain [Trichonephila inaurata madagascariensis]|uniref:Hemocyanin G chain n=1 Tax=Trichonephila inaurata madagascariensis TaxID=2747483 RepID=A0A8X6IF88_9ARAC|nr:hemocyanin G chain [Trichonephila inaurata madagascariensis]
MIIKEKQDQILPLFEQLTTLTRQQIPPEPKADREAADFNDFLALAKQARDVVNEGLFVYALSVAVVHRDDCRGVTLPPIQDVFPDRFIPAETINLASKEAKNKPSEDISVEIEDTGNILEPEYKLAYFREHIGVNAHHWYWHVVYPANWSVELTGKKNEGSERRTFLLHTPANVRQVGRLRKELL